MATPIDSLKKGDFIAICGLKRPMIDRYGMEQEPNFNGVPSQIVEISLPFIAVRQRDKIGSIDVRLHEVQRVSKTYADFMLSGEIKRRKLTRSQRVKAQRQAIESGCCPNCGDRLVQRMMADNKWHKFCRRCGFDGGLAIVTSDGE